MLMQGTEAKTTPKPATAAAPTDAPSTEGAEAIDSTIRDAATSVERQVMDWVGHASDWLDGVLARRMHQVTRLGQMLDPAADRLFILVTLVGLAWRGVVPVWLVVVLVLRDVLLAVLLVALARSGYPPLRVHLAGKAGT